MKWHCGHVCLLRLRQGKSIETYIHVITVIVVNKVIRAEAWRLQGMSYTKRNLKKNKLGIACRQTGLNLVINGSSVRGVGTWLTFGYWWAAEGFTLALFRTKKILKYIRCLRQKRKCTPSCFEGIYGNYNRANPRYSHCFCIQNSSRKSNRSCRKYRFNRRTRNYILCLGI